MEKKILIMLFLSLLVGMSVQAQNDSIQQLSTAQLLKLAKQYRFGIVRDVDLNKAVAIYKHLSREGNTRAMNELGRMYLTGDGVKKNPHAAFNLFKKAAEEGNKKAMCNLALIYQKGIGRPVNFQKAFAWYQKAAEAGSAQGYYGTGYFLYKGLGTEQNYDQAIYYLKKGAEKNHAGCAFLLGSFYANGFGDKQDLAKAKEYFDLASRNGHDWTIDVTKNGLLDSINVRRNKAKRMARANMPTSGFSTTSFDNVRMEDLVGKWEGVAYTYDWSNTKLVNSEPVSCRFEHMGDSVAMYYYKNDSLITIYTPFAKDDYYTENRLKDYQKDFKWVITKSQFEQKDNQLTAKLRSLNLKTRNYRRPMVLSLHRVSDGNIDAETTGINQITYNGGTLYLNGVDIADNAVIRIYSTGGVLVKQFNASDLHHGENAFRCDHLNLNAGTYIVEVQNSSGTQSHKFIVK